MTWRSEPGTTLGVLGRNGAGKSTLLKMISGVSRRTTGEVRVDGRLAAIFSTGAGFNPEFTGRDNVMLNGLILGIEPRRTCWPAWTTSRPSRTSASSWTSR